MKKIMASDRWQPKVAYEEILVPFDGEGGLDFEIAVRAWYGKGNSIGQKKVSGTIVYRWGEGREKTSHFTLPRGVWNALTRNQAQIDQCLDSEVPRPSEGEGLPF